MSFLLLPASWAIQVDFLVLVLLYFVLYKQDKKERKHLIVITYNNN